MTHNPDFTPFWDKLLFEIPKNFKLIHYVVTHSDGDLFYGTSQTPSKIYHKKRRHSDTRSCPARRHGSLDPERLYNQWRWGRVSGANKPITTGLNLLRNALLTKSHQNCNIRQYLTGTRQSICVFSIVILLVQLLISFSLKLKKLVKLWNVLDLKTLNSAATNHRERLKLFSSLTKCQRKNIRLNFPIFGPLSNVSTSDSSFSEITKPKIDQYGWFCSLFNVLHSGLLKLI